MVSINFSLPITVDGMPLKILKFRGHFGLFAAGNRVPCYNGSCFPVESSRATSSLRISPFCVTTESVQAFLLFKIRKILEFQKI